MVKYSPFMVGVLSLYVGVQSLYGWSAVSFWFEYSHFMVEVQSLYGWSRKNVLFHVHIYIYTVVSVFDS